MNLKLVAIGLGVLAAVSFAVVLVATLPATLVARSLKLDPSVPISGTVWSGRAVLPGGDRVEWRGDALASILSLGMKASVSVTGELTDLNARLSTSGSAVTLSNMTGVAGWSLVHSLWPGMGLDCDVGIRFNDVTIVAQERATYVSGHASGSAGTCTGAGAQKSFEIAATEAIASTTNGTSQIRIALASDAAALLADLALGAAGDIKVTAQPLALKLVPGANASGPLVYEMRAR